MAEKKEVVAEVVTEGEELVDVCIMPDPLNPKDTVYDVYLNDKHYRLNRGEHYRVPKEVQRIIFESQKRTADLDIVEHREFTY